MVRSVVITGGTAGIGLATAEIFAKKGYNVAVIGRHAGRVDDAVEQLRAHGTDVMGFAIDVADSAALVAAAHDVARRFGAIDVWVNNAMVTVIAPADRVDADEYRRVTEVTYLGQVFGTLAALRVMKKQNFGTIIQVNSGLGYRPIPLQVAYAGAKAACVRFTDGLRSELAHEGKRIALTTVYLPAVNSTQFSGWSRNKMGHRQTAPAKFHDPRRCGEAIFKAAVRPTCDVWVGRSTLMMSFLQTLWPGAADRKAASAWEGQLADEPIAPNKGNLFDPCEGPAEIDGPEAAENVYKRSVVVTSRSRQALVVGLLVAGVGALVHCIHEPAARRRVRR